MFGFTANQSNQGFHCQLKTSILCPQLREKIHLQRPRQFRRGREGNVHVRFQYLRNVGARDVHPLGQRGLVEPELFHPAENLTEEDGADMINGIHEEEGGEKRWRLTMSFFVWRRERVLGN